MTMVEMRVHMDCAGCESKIKKALQKLDGVDDIDIDINNQKVTVMGWADQKKVLKTVRRTGRRAELWPYPYNPDYYNFTQQYYYLHQHQPQQQQQQVSYYTSQPPPPPPPPPPSSYDYNYERHGCSGDDYGYYHQSHYSDHLFDERTVAMFSDDNPNACSIM